MKHLGINQLLVASAILAPALASDNSKTDKVTMPLAEVEKQETMSMSLDESSSKAAKVTTAPVSSSIESPQSALSKSGKSSSGNTGKQSNMSMPAHVSLSMLSNGKATKAFGKSGKSVDSKAFKGVNDADSNSLQKGKSDKDMSLSLPYTENKESLKVPSKQPSVTSKKPTSLNPTTQTDSKLPDGNILLWAKTAKLTKEEDSTEALFESVFGTQEDNKNLIKEKALWQWQQGQN